MKIVRFVDIEGVEGYGALQIDGSVLRLEGMLSRQMNPTTQTVSVAKILCPISPTAIIGIGLNYRRHALEAGAAIPARPVVFFKSLNTVQNPGDPILIPTHFPSVEVDYECELAVVIGKSGKNIPRASAFEHVLGYMCANDVSARDWQLKLGGGQWSRGKMFDTFAPLGPCLVTPETISDPNALNIRTILNGTTVQHWNTSDMIFNVAALIEFLSGSTTLLAGTVILTGTPHGVGMAQKPPRWLRAGDVVSIEIEGIGTLTNPVALETSS
jgi:2-keto-4-pentenoate hydratase/2-oxohepta-3-ene-1,7-dioic acid hydratase in catechol pathway